MTMIFFSTDSQPKHSKYLLTMNNKKMEYLNTYAKTIKHRLLFLHIEIYLNTMIYVQVIQSIIREVEKFVKHDVG